MSRMRSFGPAILLIAFASVAHAQGLRHGLIDETSTGTVLVQRHSPSSVLMLVDSYQRGGPDGKVDAFVRIDEVEAPGDDIGLMLNDARVIVGERRVIAYSPSQHAAVIFSSTKDACDSCVFANGTAVHQYYGNVVRHTGDISLPPLPAKPAQVSAYQFYQDDPWDDENDATPSCDAGGSGSTSCSITCCSNSCSTSCSPGWTACCNCSLCTTSCKCVK